MPITRDRPEPNRKPTPKDYTVDYSKYTTDELLDERNFFKSQGLNTAEIDSALRKKYN
jgi:hypothetical protein